MTARSVPLRLARLAPAPLLLLALAAGGGAGEPRSVKTERFATASVCALCHANSPQAGAMRDARGSGVAPYDLWRSSMMANAARDPFFRAALAAEAAATPARREEIEAKCLQCHAPMASALARAAGRPGLAVEDLAGDSDLAALGRDGVSCTLCHQILPDGLGDPASFGGHFALGENGEMFGPHRGTWGLPMARITGFWPRHGDHLLRSELCATCHTVYLEAHDAEGRPTGARLLEQTPFLEWRNSAYAPERTCQSCHMPVDSDGGAIRTRLARSTHGGDIRQLEPREPFGRHLFVGGNTWVPRLLRDNAAELGVEAPPEAFDATIEAARAQLASRTARVVIEEVTPAVGSAQVRVRVENLAGHKLPTGHPSRRAWIRLRVRGLEGTTFFASGDHDDQGRIVGEGRNPLPFESAGGPIAPHRDVIASRDEAQVYEAVLADGKGAPTFTMLRAERRAKDNRLLPRGWKPDHADASATAPEGVGSDPDFEGGADAVTYEVRLPEELDAYVVEATLLFQPIAPRFVAELCLHDLPEVRALRRMLESARPAPEVLATATLTVKEE